MEANQIELQKLEEATGEKYVSASQTDFRPDIFKCNREDGTTDYVNLTQHWYVKNTDPQWDEQGNLVFPGDMVGYGKLEHISIHNVRGDRLV